MALSSPDSIADSIVLEIYSKQGLTSTGAIISPDKVKFLSKSEINTIIADKLSNDLKNIELSGTYVTGTTPSGSPDPASGTNFKLSVVKTFVTGQTIALQTTNGTLNEWVKNIIAAISLTTFSPSDSGITITSFSPTQLKNIISAPYVPGTDFKENMKKLIRVIYTAIKTTPALTPAPTMASTSGIGSGTLLNFT